MTLETWNLIFSAATAGMVLVGGIWLKYVVTQQLATKDATIETVKTALEVLKTKLDVVERERAPEIVKDLRVMEEHADKVTGEKNRLTDEITKLTEKQKQDESYKPILQLKSEIDGLSFAANLIAGEISQIFQEVTGTAKSCTNLDIDKVSSSDLLMRFVNANTVLNSRTHLRIDKLKEHLARLENRVKN
jgi:hypothetical protein